MNYYNENDPAAAQWLRNLIADGLIPAGIVDDRSITEVRGDDLNGFAQCHFFAGIGGWPYALELAGWPADRPVWTGSCPCQDFSNAGKQAGIGGARDLWPIWQSLIAQRRPAAIFGEQSDDSPQWWDRAAHDLENLNYAAAALHIPARTTGACHLRNRLYFVADDTSQHIDARRGMVSRDCQWASVSAGGLARLEVDGGRWRADGWTDGEPTLMRGHDGLSRKLDRIALKGFGNAIVPQVAAEFIKAYMSVEVAA